MVTALSPFSQPTWQRRRGRGEAFRESIFIAALSERRVVAEQDIAEAENASPLRGIYRTSSILRTARY